MLDAVLSGVRFPAGRLYKRLRDEGLVYSMHAYNVFGTDPGYFAIYAATAPANAAKARAVIEEELEKIKAAPPTEEELNTARENWLTMLALDNQDNGDVAYTGAREEAVGLGYDWRDGFVAKLNAVTGEDVSAAARKYLVNPVVVITSPAVATSPAAEPPSTPTRDEK